MSRKLCKLTWQEKPRGKKWTTPMRFNIEEVERIIREMEKHNIPYRVSLFQRSCDTVEGFLQIVRENCGGSYS